MRAEVEEMEKLKRMELIKVKQGSWVLLRLCKEIVGENKTGWEVGENEINSEKNGTGGG